MAYGIEEIAEMQLTGPVKGGDMVMKPDQAPVGAAALLNKMQKKNTPGIFKLPEVDKEMPAFMKVAAEGVEEQNTANLENQEIMRIMGQYGVGPEEAKRMYDEMIYGYERESAEVKPWDWRTILKMIQSGMSMEDIEAQMPKPVDNETAAMKFPGNFTSKDQDVTELPRNLKTAPDAEETKLAYITDDEQAMLAFMKPGTPHKGPEGVPSYDSQDYGTYVSSEDWADYDTGKSDAPAAYTDARKKASEDKDSQYYDQAVKEIAQEKAQGGGKITDYAKAAGIDIFDPSTYGDSSKTATETKDNTMLDKALNAISFPGSLALKGVDALSAALAGWEEAQVEKLVSKIGTGDAATGWGNLLAAMTTDGKLNKRGEDWFEDWGDKLEDPSKDNEWADMKDEEKLEKLIAMASAGGGDEFEKTYNPQKYYESKPGENTADYQKRMRKLGVTAKELAQLQAEGKLGTEGNPSGFTRANTQLIEEGRKRLEEERGGGKDRHSGTGQPTEQVTETETEVTENITPDERAGAWNVGGTMPYSDALYTQGTEMDVPLGRRFEIDKDQRYLTNNRTKEDIYKYATEGGYNQLEPFQNYLARRRKHLGEQPDEWFDEEGNVIYSNTATV